MLKIRPQVGRSAADKAPDVRELHDRLVELDHHRLDQRKNPAVVLSGVLPGEVVWTDTGAAPLNVMSYFSYGSIVRL